MDRTSRCNERSIALFVVSAFVFSWVIARAAVQSLTIDEATTFELWIAPPSPEFWNGASNNHILNSLIIKLAVSLFGATHVSLRAGAIIGAGVYLAGAVRLSATLFPCGVSGLVAFVFITCSPFVLDYLVAARGYSLACGFLLWLIVLAIEPVEKPTSRQVAKRCVLMTGCGCLAIAANFSFGFAAACLLAVLVPWMVQRTSGGMTGGARFLHWTRCVASAACTALGISVILLAHAVANWPSGQLWWGANSWRETFQSILASSTFQPNPYVVNPWLLPAIVFVQPLLFPALIAFTGARLCVRMVPLLRKRSLDEPGGIAFALLLLLSLSLTLACHAIAFRYFGMRLPLERTALHLVVIFHVLAVVVASLPRRDRFDGFARLACHASLLATACFFLFCFRLTYFKEWEWNAETNRAYYALAHYSHSCGIRKAASSWHYSAVLNTYRVISGGTALEEIPGGKPYPVDRMAYVLFYAFDKDFIDNQGLRVVFRGDATDIVVAIRPEAMVSGCADLRSR